MSSSTVINKSQGGIQSLEIGLTVLDVLINHNEPMMLKDIAEALKMHPAKVHRYLVSLIRTQYARQLADGRYALGQRIHTLAYMGQIKLGQQSVMQRLNNAANQIKDTLNCSVQITKWFDEGPIVIQSIEADTPISIVTRVGSRMPLTTSATGRLFASFQPQSVVKALAFEEWQKKAINDIDNNQNQKQNQLNKQWRKFNQLLLPIREQGYATVKGDFLIGISAISIAINSTSTSGIATGNTVPLIDRTESKTDAKITLEYALTVIGTSEQLPLARHHAIIAKIKKIAKQHQLIDDSLC